MERGVWEINILCDLAVCSLIFLFLGLLPTISRAMNSMQLKIKVKRMERTIDGILSMKGLHSHLGSCFVGGGGWVSAMSTGSSWGRAVGDMFPGWILRRMSTYPSIPPGCRMLILQRGHELRTEGSEGRGRELQHLRAIPNLVKHSPIYSHSVSKQ